MSTSKADLDKLVIIGDRLLIKPRSESDRTASGLFLPPGIKEKEQVQSGYVIKVGPGYPIPVPTEDSEPWKEKEPIKYIPLQAQPGDLAIFLQKGAYEVFYQDQKYFIVPQNSVLMLERDEGLFD
ncbi:co-chaperone GroES family protein [Pontibacter sp. G13]|uniref:co-chaperone GroES n=1 Tax=Pontibacter sp. G13 TaxID=3074898 RepID=UPI00288B4091|nr:co-chaperone GroES family protein [Pontibacter sp. G13]WNJ20747.1 co-chaperone GroES family protein [Pontibacter sp. G13]